jgi:hypothetical protein
VNFENRDEAKAMIHAAVDYLLQGTTDGTRGDIVQEIKSIVRQAADGSPFRPPDPLEDDLPGG